MKVLLAVEDPVFGDAIADFVVKHRFPPATEFKVVHTISPVMLDHPMSAYPLFLESLAKETVKAALELVHHVAGRIKDELPWQAKVLEEILEGAPVGTIITQAKEWAADLIIVGSHGRHGFERFLIGSVSTGIACQAHCSVLVVRLTPGQKEALSSRRPA